MYENQNDRQFDNSGQGQNENDRQNWDDSQTQSDKYDDVNSNNPSSEERNQMNHEEYELSRIHADPNNNDFSSMNNEEEDDLDEEEEDDLEEEEDDEIEETNPSVYQDEPIKMRDSQDPLSDGYRNE